MERTIFDVEAVKRIFLEYPARLEKVENEYRKICSERQDLLHALELGSLDAIRMTKITKDLKDIQLKRRKLKDELEILKHICTFVKHPKKPNKQRIDSMIGNVKNAIDVQSKRTYRMRIRKDLQELIK